jgi:LuxR family maltose regulon positive regulatory protein
MIKTDSLIRTKLCLPFTRQKLVPRPRLQERIAQGLGGPLTLIIAPAGFGKTTLVASCITDCGMPMAWLSLDKNDNQEGRFLSYLVAVLQEADHTIGSRAVQLMAAPGQAQLETILTSLINDLDSANTGIVLVLDDYQFISSQTIHDGVVFLLEHCPKTFHLVIASRSDPPLPLARLRARGQMVELRAADLRFTVTEVAQFLNDVMDLHLDAGSVAVLEVRTEGWIAGLQMAALSMRDRKDLTGFIEGFSGTNRYILDYLLEEVLASQPPEIQHFLLYTSVLERLTAPLCDFLLTMDETPQLGDAGVSYSELLSNRQSTSVLEYLERVNLFLVPLDDERIWYRYHHLFADLLRAQLQKSLNAEGIAKLHIRAAEWHGQNGLILEAIYHAALASDPEMVERFIHQNHMELVSRGEMSGIRFWIGKLSRDLVYSRPWLCIYEAYSHAWFGELDEAIRLLGEAEKRFQPEISTPEVLLIQGNLAYVKSRITAMRGDIHRAIELCLEAREYIPDSNLALQLDTRITLGYEYFLNGDFPNASQNLNETIQMGKAAGAVINTVAASCVMARLHAIQGLLHKSYDTYQTAAQLIPDEGSQHLGARSLVEVGFADVLCEWNDLDAALVHIKQGLDLLPLWGKVDDLALAYITLARIHLAQANDSEATDAVEKATHLVQTRGVFSEARHAVEHARVKLWLAKGNLQATNHWAAPQEERLYLDNLLEFENELTQISQARVLIAKNKLNEAIHLLSRLEENAQSGGRNGRLIETMILKGLAMQRMGDASQAMSVLTRSLALAEPEGYVRVFLDEGQPMQMLLTQWLVQNNASPSRVYAFHLLSHFDAEPFMVTIINEKTSPTDDSLVNLRQVLVEPLSRRELEVLHLIALGKTNQEIAQELVIARGTVKAHAASIYRKLDVANRTEAVARARKLDILP